MAKYVEGYTFDDVVFCPKCMYDASTGYADGSFECDDCGFTFYVIEKERERDENE